ASAKHVPVFVINRDGRIWLGSARNSVARVVDFRARGIGRGGISRWRRRINRWRRAFPATAASAAYQECCRCDACGDEAGFGVVRGCGDCFRPRCNRSSTGICNESPFPGRLVSLQPPQGAVFVLENKVAGFVIIFRIDVVDDDPVSVLGDQREVAAGFAGSFNGTDLVAVELQRYDRSTIEFNRAVNGNFLGFPGRFRNNRRGHSTYLLGLTSCVEFGTGAHPVPALGPAGETRRNELPPDAALTPYNLSSPDFAKMQRALLRICRQVYELFPL